MVHPATSNGTAQPLLQDTVPDPPALPPPALAAGAHPAALRGSLGHEASCLSPQPLGLPRQSTPLSPGYCSPLALSSLQPLPPAHFVLSAANSPSPPLPVEKDPSASPPWRYQASYQNHLQWDINSLTGGAAKIHPSRLLPLLPPFQAMTVPSPVGCQSSPSPKIYLAPRLARPPRPAARMPSPFLCLRLTLAFLSDFFFKDS